MSNNKVLQIKTALASKEKALINFLDNKENALRFMSAVVHSVEKNPGLLKCDLESLEGAFMECATLGLFPSNASGDCYVLPYKNKAQFILGYRGLKTLAFRSGILRCGTDVVRKNDEFREERGTVQKLVHIPATADRGEAIGAYAWAEISKGVDVYKFMTRDDIMRIKTMSPSAGTDFSPWNKKNDPELWMWQKTVFKQLGKMLPTSDKLERAIYLDNVSERGGYVKKEKEIVEAPFDRQHSSVSVVSGPSYDDLMKKLSDVKTIEDYELLAKDISKATSLTEEQREEVKVYASDKVRELQKQDAGKSNQAQAA